MSVSTTPCNPPLLSTRSISASSEKKALTGIRVRISCGARPGPCDRS
jgi:hypothetical protein